MKTLLILLVIVFSCASVSECRARSHNRHGHSKHRKGSQSLEEPSTKYKSRVSEATGRAAVGGGKGNFASKPAAFGGGKGNFATKPAAFGGGKGYFGPKPASPATQNIVRPPALVVLVPDEQEEESVFEDMPEMAIWGRKTKEYLPDPDLPSNSSSSLS